jgi:hypothetical protein
MGERIDEHIRQETPHLGDIVIRQVGHSFKSCLVPSNGCPLDVRDALCHRFAAELDVARGIRASSTDRDDVIELKPLAGTTVDASSLVAAPDFMAYSFRYCLPW